MRGILVLTLFVSLLIFVGCSNEESPVHTPDYFPLSIGNTWTFDVSEFDTTGAETTYVETHTIDHKTSDTLGWYVMFIQTDTSGVDSILYRKDQYALWAGFTFRTGFIVVFLPVRVAPLEPEVGQQWSDTVRNAGIYTNAEVFEKSDQNVPAGNFSTYACKLDVKLIGDNSSLYRVKYWFADNIGPVRIDMVEVGKDSTVYSLRNYSIQQ